MSFTVDTGINMPPGIRMPLTNRNTHSSPFSPFILSGIWIDPCLRWSLVVTLLWQLTCIHCRAISQRHVKERNTKNVEYSTALWFGYCMAWNNLSYLTIQKDPNEAELAEKPFWVSQPMPLLIIWGTFPQSISILGEGSTDLCRHGLCWVMLIGINSPQNFLILHLFFFWSNSKLYPLVSQLNQTKRKSFWLRRENQ